MHPARIAELLEPFFATSNDQRLTPDDLASISTYIDILLRWNARINLTAIRNEEDIVTRHFGESLFAARHLFPNRTAAFQSRATSGFSGGRADLEGRVKSGEKAGALALSVADIGSGAGFPGIPLKLWAPQISLTLIESNHKKATFLREVARALTLTDINIQNARVQDLLQPRQQHAAKPRRKDALVKPAPLPEHQHHPLFDAVTLRAVERFPEVLRVAAALVAPGGRLALLIGSAQQKQAQTALPSFHWLPPTQVPLSTSRLLLIGTREP